MDFCGDHKEVSGCAKRLEVELKEEIWPKINTMSDIQKTRDMISKRDLLHFIYWAAPSLSLILALVFGIAVYLATSRVTFASRELVLSHEHRIASVEKSLEKSEIMFSQLMEYQKAILVELRKD